jgi:hypothetical protein
VSKTVYQWRPRANFNIDPQVAGEELAKIKGHNSGDLTPEMVLKAAADKASPLHAAFEWDDAKAAEQQRLYVAGNLIRSVVVTISGPVTQKAAPVKVSVTETPTKNGTAAARVVSEAELQQKRIERGWTELDKWLKAFGDLPEFAQIAGVIGVLTTQRQSKAA